MLRQQLAKETPQGPGRENPFWKNKMHSEDYKTSLRGHPILFIRGVYVFADTMEPTVETWKERDCGHCEKANTAEGHDGCLGVLPGVMNACCGHGVISDAYVQFSKNVILPGQEAIDWIKSKTQ